MLQECMDALNIKKDGIYVDATFGGGGHSKAILKLLGENGRLYAFDQDEEALAQAPEDSRLTVIKANFRFAENYLAYFEAIPVDGILADLGISSHHIDAPERGFAFMQNGPLDMRMDGNNGITASEWLNQVEIRELTHALSFYGDIKNAKSLANAIQGELPIETTYKLVRACEKVAPKQKNYAYLAKVFQAIRIAVNDEMGALKDFLESLEKVTSENARVVIMSYHSLEDKLVKKWINSGKIDGKIEKDFYGKVIKPFSAFNKKPIEAQEKELEKNSRSRSAKLRIAVRNA